VAELLKTQDKSSRQSRSPRTDRDMTCHDGDPAAGVEASMMENLPRFISCHRQYRPWSTGGVATDPTWSREEPPGLQVEKCGAISLLWQQSCVIFTARARLTGSELTAHLNSPGGSQVQREEAGWG